ncbi:uncharacterized protein METZ01_LOCUS304965, partial [marine metagenome]
MPRLGRGHDADWGVIWTSELAVCRYNHKGFILTKSATFKIWNPDAEVNHPLSYYA